MNFALPFVGKVGLMRQRGPRSSNQHSRVATGVAIATSGFLLIGCGQIGSLGGGSGSSQAVNISVDISNSGSNINQGLLGVDGPGPDGATQPLASLGLKFDRTDVGFQGSYNCSNGTWDSSSLDSRVAQIGRENSTPLLIVDYSPSCLAASGPSLLSSQYAPPDQGPDQAIWKALVTEMAYHEITAEGVRYFEVWNEPDGLFWSGGLAGYEQLYLDTATALQSAASKAGVTINIGGPALANITGSMDTLFLDPFLSYVSSHNLPMDFLSWHVYADYPLFGPIGPIPMPPSWMPITWYNPALSSSTFTDQANSAESALAAYPDLHPILVIDEWNVDAGYDPRQANSYAAAFAVSVLEKAQDSKIANMVFFDVNDSPNDPRANWGLLDSNLNPKPVYNAFMFWHEMATTQVASTVSNDSDGNVGVIASKSANGKITVLCYNFKGYDLMGNYGTSDPTPYDHQINLDISGLGSGSYSFTRVGIDASHNGTQLGQGSMSASNNVIAFNLPGQSVDFVTLTPTS